MSINSFNNIFIDNDALLDNSNFPLIISLSTLARILDKKENTRVSHSLKQNDSLLEKIEIFILKKYKEVTLIHLKNHIIKKLTLEMSNKSIGTTNPNSLSLLKAHINSLECEIYFLHVELRVKSDLIKSLISSKSAENPVTVQTTDTADP